MMEKICTFIYNIFLIIQYLCIYIKLFFIKLRIKLAKNNWRLSKNRNFYNPILAATVYRSGSIWKIARYGNFFGHFEDKKDAMDSIFQKWLEENKFSDSITALEIALQNIKQKLFSTDENNKNSYKKEEVADKNYRIIENAENNINFIAKYFYLAQTTQSCYKCRENILVNAIVLPEGFKAIDHDTIEDLEQQGISVEESSLFCSQDYLSILSYLTYISPKALDEIYKHVDKQLFQKRYSFSTNYDYYRSICSCCDSAQEDNFVILEYNSAFYPSNIEDFKKIKFYKIDEEIKILAGGNSVGYGYSPSGLVYIGNVHKN